MSSDAKPQDVPAATPAAAADAAPAAAAPPAAAPVPPSPGQAAKEAGNARIKAKDFEGAIAHYTEAIALDHSQAAFYSNRALALSKLGRYAEAIRDCDAALAADPEFLKAYYYKADAILKQGKGPEAVPVASAALAKGPSPGLRANLEKLVVAGSATQTATDTGMVARLQKLVPFQRTAAMTMALLYFIPLPLSFTQSAYRFSLWSMFLLLAFEVYNTHGKPWGMAFVQRIVDPNRRYMDFTVHRFVIAAFLVMSKPYALGLMSLLVAEAAQVLVVDVPRMNLLGLGARVSQLVHEKLLPRVLTTTAPNQNAAAKWVALRRQVARWSALLEVLLGLFLLVEAFTPGRAVLQTVLLWQFLRTIAMFCQETRDAFSSVDHAVRGVVARVPAVATQYGRLSTYLGTWGDLPQQQAAPAAAAAGGGGFMQRAAAAASSCNIM